MHDAGWADQQFTRAAWRLAHQPNQDLHACCHFADQLAAGSTIAISLQPADLVKQLMEFEHMAWTNGVLVTQ